MFLIPIKFDIIFTRNTMMKIRQIFLQERSSRYPQTVFIKTLFVNGILFYQLLLLFLYSACGTSDSYGAIMISALGK